MVNFSMKMASTVTVATLLVTALSSSVVSAASEFLPYAELLADNAVIGTQSTEAGYRLGATVTRAELAKVAANLGAYTPTDCTGVFADVTSDLGDLCGYVEALADAGVVASATNFRPSASVTRAEMTKMLLGVIGESGSATDAGYMDTASLGDLAMYINRANEMGCANTASYYRPNATASRGEAFKIASCVAGLDVTTPVTPVPPTATGTTGTGVIVTPAASGSVSVSLDGAAVAQYVPKNASSVKVGTIKLTAGAAATTVSSVVVTRSGLGNVADISSLQLAQAGVAVSDARTMSTSSQAATLKFTSPLVLAAGTSASFDVLVSLNGLENNQHQFTVTAVNVVGGSATGTPVTLGLLNTTSYSVKSVSVDSVVAGSITSGKTNQTFATVKLTPNGEATMNGFTLSKVTGEDYTKVMSNVAAYHNNVKIGTVTVTSDKITVTGLALARLSGEQASIEIKGDATYVGPNATTTFKVAESTDVSATEKSTGYIMAVGGTFPTATQTLNLNALDLTLTKMSTGSKTVAPGTSGIELLNVQVKSDATFDVSAYNVTLTTGTNLTNFVDDKVTVYVNGVDYEWTNAQGTTKSFSASADRFRVEPGTPVTIRVVGNIRSDAGINGHTPTLTPSASYVATLNLTQVKNVSNGSTVAVTKSQAGDTVTVKNGTAIIKDATTAPASARAVYANADIEIGRFAVRAEAENVTVRKITLTNAATLLPVTDFTTVISSSSVKLIDVATNAQISATVTVAAGSIVLESMSAEVLKDTDRNFKVVVTTSGFGVAEHGKKIDLAVALNTVDKASGGAAGFSPVSGMLPSVSSTDYVVGVRPPAVTLVKKSANVFLMTVTNVDSESDLILNSVTAQVKPVATNNTTYTANYCLRTEGTSDANACGAPSTTVAAVPGAASAISQTLPVTVSKNSSVTREIFVQSNYQDPIDLLATVSKLTYNTTVTESYDVSAK
jgi:S-layer homology domain